MIMFMLRALLLMGVYVGKKSGNIHQNTNEKPYVLTIHLPSQSKRWLQMLDAVEPSSGYTY